jgi:uncharacterized membrane protein YgdD (TMEM256/DUF423 family)
MKKRTVLIIGAALAGLAVALGAFGSHALRDTLLRSGRTDTFETAVRYHMYHALALLYVGILFDDLRAKVLSMSAFAFTSGIVLFSGSLYLLCLYPLPGIVFLTPVGGFLFIIGWGLLVYACWQKLN